MRSCWSLRRWASQPCLKENSSPKGISLLMFSSTIIPTIGRATLARAVLSVLEQDFDADDFEVIVVNDSGQPLPEEDWQRSPRVRVIETQRRERSVARNTGAAIAKGKYLHFLDDDDILLPGALRVFWELSHKNPNADWLYGSWRTVDNDGNQVDEFHPGLTGNIFALLVSGEGLPLQASLLKTSSFFMAGGYDPTPILTGVEDRDVGRRLAFMGTLAFAPIVVAQVRIGEVGSSTNWNKIAEGDRWGREKALQTPNSYRRMRDSATSRYWRGRVSRAFFASMVWNLKQRNLFLALSRLTDGLTMTGLNLFFP
ncbi:MAG: glycosyltransferase family 2 protein, partial [Anaerolineae bacterium]|nr:glycosyltransferase family 2 protein [Anaerolineae bacterium]